MPNSSRQFTRFVVLFQGRAGSTYLIESLDSHSMIHAEGEQLFGKKQQGYEAQVQWTREFFEPISPVSYSAVGFKTKFVDILSPDDYARLLRSLDVKIIHLERRNLVKQVISWMNSDRLYQATADWNLYREADRLPPLEVDVADFAERLQLLMRGQDRLSQYVDTLELPTLHLEYEDLLTNFETTMDKVFQFLEQPSEKVNPHVKKNTSDNLRMAVANFDLLRARYAGTRYEWMFDETKIPTSSLYSADYYEELKNGAQNSAREIVPLILDWIQPESVIDIGCGSGAWLSVFEEFGVETYLGVDGEYIDKTVLEIPPDKFMPFDLTNPLRLEQKFDLVVSLEVAEHLPAEQARTFADTLTRLGPVILFSAAIPRQGGANHLNEQWPHYWVHHFQKRGYQVVDCLREKLWQNENVEPWYAQNMLIFVRQDSIGRYPLLERELGQTDASRLARVHPQVHRQSFKEIKAETQWLPAELIHTVRVEITEPIADISLPASVERLHCDIVLAGEQFGRIELPVCEGFVPGAVISDAVAAEHAWIILGRFFRYTLYPQLKIEQNPAGLSLWRGSLRLANSPLESEDGFWARVHSQIGWTVFLQELWGRPDWPTDYFYDSQLVEAPAKQRHDPKTPLTVEVSEPLPDITGDASELDVILTVGGAALGNITLPIKNGYLSAQELRVALTHFSGFELCCLAVREGIIGRPLVDSMPLRFRLAARVEQIKADTTSLPLPETIIPTPFLAHTAKQALAPAAAGLVLGRRVSQPIGVSASRRAALPSQTMPELMDLARESGEPWLQIVDGGEQPIRVSYAPDLLSPSFLQSAKSGPLTTGTPAAHRNGVSNSTTSQLPILLYHRITPDRSTLSNRYYITPEVFEQQICALRDGGYHSVSLDEWRLAVQTKKPLPGRAVLITFDDGYTDFQTYAWPILKQYGFSATVLLTAAEVGGVTQWHHPCGAGVPLLDWPALRQLQQEGIEFGSLSTNYYPLTALSVEDIVREAARSRLILNRGLGASINTFAYPYGDVDPGIQHLIGACGYIIGLSQRRSLSKFRDSLLALPRIEVRDSDNLTQLIEKLIAGIT